MVFHTTLFLFFILFLTPISTNELCKWYGVAPFCFIGNSCPDGCFKTLESNRGDGLLCWFSHKKNCCCPKRALDGLVNNILPNGKK